MVQNVLRMVKECCGNLEIQGKIPFDSHIHMFEYSGWFTSNGGNRLIIKSANSEQGGPVTEKAEYDDIAVEVLSGRFFERAKKFCIVYEHESKKQATLIKKF